MVRFRRRNFTAIFRVGFSTISKALLCLIFLFQIGCEGENATDELFGTGTDETEVPVPSSRSVRITSPESDGESVGYLAHVEGTCNPAGGVITFFGSGSGSTLCQIGGTFSGDIDVSGAPIGTVTISARLEDSAGNQSAISTRRFSKTSTACDSASARADTYANFSTGGDGGAVPWQICTPDQFENIASNLSDNFQLENDIDFDGSALTPMGGTFSGELDGQGYTVRDLSISQSGDSYGIFRQAVGPAHFHDLSFEDITIDGRDRIAVLVGYVVRSPGDNVRFEDISFENIAVNARNSVGTVAGQIGANNNAGNDTITIINNITVENSTFSGNSYVGSVVGFVRNTLGSFSASNLVATDISVTGSGSYVGGIVGYIEETANTNDNFHVNSDEITSTITGGTHYAAGIVGRIQGGANSNFTATANIVGNGTTRDYAGGLVGLLNAGTYTGTCSYTGTVNASDYRYVGGAFGYVNDNITIDGCVVDANVYGREQVGGIIGRADNGVQLTNSSNNPTIAKSLTASSNYAGGAIGYANDDLVIDSVATNLNIDCSDAYAGGLLGRARDDASCIDSTAYGYVTAVDQYVGGAIGYVRDRVLMDNCRAEGDVQGPQRVGGLVGYSRNSGDFVDASAIGNVTSTSGGDCGGLVGYSRQSVDYLDSYATGDVDCFGGNAGGLVGYAYRYNVFSRTYATGDVVSGGNYTGGLAGMSNQNHNTVTDSFAVGDVTSMSGSFVGGLVGYMRTNNAENFKNNFALGNVTGNEYVGGIVGYFNRPSNDSMKQSYYLGRVTKHSAATGANSRFGAVVGSSNDTTFPYGVEDSSVFYVSGNDVYDEALDQSLVGQNTFGTAKSDADLRDSSTYPAGYDFTAPGIEWEMNLGGYVLPGTSGAYAYPLQDWQQ